MFRILPYKPGSASVRKLKTALDAKLIKLTNSRYRPSDNHLVINWGNSTRPAVLEGVQLLNEPEAVAVASNKLKAFQVMKEAGVITVPFTTDRLETVNWLRTYIRTKLTGHSGEGIVVTEGEFDSNFVSAPLYTKGIENHGEYRVHVFDGEVILYQKKSRRVDGNGDVVTAEGEDALVRNLATNWIYRTGHLERTERIEALAIQAVQALGLDFGAVDIIKDERGTVYVLEVNTAPGISNTETGEAYINAFKSLI